MRTAKKYRQILDCYLILAFGDKELNSLSAIELQTFTANLTKQGAAPNTVNGIVSVLKRSLKCAVLVGVAQKEETDKIVRPKTRERKIECFSRGEQRKIEEYALKKSGKYFGILLCLYTGLRIGELLALTWRDVNFANGLLTVTKSCYDAWKNGKYEKIIDTPKTESSQRVIPIPGRLIPYLKKLKKQSTGEYVVSGRGAFGAQVRSYQKTFERVLKKFGLAHRGFHALRHTFATRAIECGMDVKTLSEILGHKNPTVTLKRYAHSLIEHKTEMMNRVGKLFSVCEKST